MKLTKEQASLVLTKLNNYDYNNGRRPCVICGNQKWLLNDTIFEMREFNGGGLVIGGTSAIMPVISLSCTECGHTMFISAIKMGIITPQASDTNTDSDSKSNM